MIIIIPALITMIANHSRTQLRPSQARHALTLLGKPSGGPSPEDPRTRRDNDDTNATNKNNKYYGYHY